MFEFRNARSSEIGIYKVFVVVDNLDLEGYSVKCFDLLVRIARN